MKLLSVLLLAAASFLAAQAPAQAQGTVYRCGNEYTNNAADAQRRGCKTMEGGNVTVVQGTRPNAPAASSVNPLGTPPVRSPSDAPRVQGSDQCARDRESRSVLTSELDKSTDRLNKLNVEYNNGEPEKQGSEARNYQKYLDRKADMEAEKKRLESDIAGIRREIGRLPAAC